MPPPLLVGIPKAVFISYVVTMIGVSISSTGWLIRFGRKPMSETITLRSTYNMIAALVISILMVVASAFFVFVALMVHGFLNMI